MIPVPRLPPRWRTVLLRRRRSMAVVLVGVAVFAGLQVLSPPPPSGERVLVAAADLPSGHRLTAGDVRTVTWPEDLVPTTALRAAVDVDGRVLAAPTGVGEPMTAARLGGSGALTSHPPGTRAVQIRAADDDLSWLLSPGDRVDVVATALPDGFGGTGSAEVVAEDVVVMALPAGGDTAAPTGSAVVLAVDAATATRLAAAVGGSALTVVLRVP